MKYRKLTCFTAMTLLMALAIPAQLGAQNNQDHNNNKQHPHYKLVDLGTFGGPNSGNNGASVIMNNAGTVTGFADTLTPDPFPASCFNADCFVSHAFQWRDGILTDLGALWTLVTR